MEPQTEVVEYRYATMKQCERAGGHVVKVSVWPIPPKRNSNEEPNLPVRCEWCGCWCIVTNNEVPTIKVMKPTVRVVHDPVESPAPRKRGRRPKKVSGPTPPEVAE